MAGLYWNNTLNQTLTLGQFHGFSSTLFNSDYMAAGMQDMGNIYSSNSGLDWYLGNNLSEGDGGNVICSETKPNCMIGNVGNAVIVSGNSGYSWGSANIVGYWEDGCDVVPMLSHPTEPDVYYAMRNFNSENTMGVCKSTDNGASYENSSNDNYSNELTRQIPNQFKISKSNPNIMYVTTGTKFPTEHFENRLYKYDEGQIIGSRWTDVFNGMETIPLPDKYYSSLAIDPLNENTLYIGLSGYQCEHLWKSTNGGYNWASISSGLIDSPIEDILIYYSDCNIKNIVTASDAGVYVTTNEGIDWLEYANKMPNTTVNKLFYNRLQCKIRASTFGRGAWEIPVRGPIIVKDNLILSSDWQGTKINEDIVVCNGGKITWIQDPGYNNPLLKFAEGKKIIVKDGGYIDFANASNLTLTSQSGNWGGIEFQGSACKGDLNNITFLNTGTPINISSVIDEPVIPDINLQGCTLCNKISISGRKNVNITDCYWSNVNNTCIEVIHVDDDLHFNNNTIVSNSQNNNSAITISYCRYLDVSNNHITNYNPCILASNSRIYLKDNELTNNITANNATAISTDFMYESNISGGSITGYMNGIYLYNSSPAIYDLEIMNNTGTSTVAVDCDYNSYPRLRPTVEGGKYIWDGGKNIFFDDNNSNQSKAFYVLDYSFPDVNFGYNFIKANQYYLQQHSSNSGFIDWNAECNTWRESPPSSSKVTGSFNITFYYIPYNCSPPEGAGNIGDSINSNSAGGAVLDNPPLDPIIINLGNGHYDTIKVTNCNITVSADKQLYFEGVKNELLSSYQQALTLYQQVIQNYQDSITAIYSLKKILTCTDKLVSIGTLDTSAYSLLRTYFGGLAVNNSTDTSFYNISSEIATKCLVRLKHYPQAITEYENMISNTTDSAKIKGCQLNIIEIYMLMTSGNQGGNAPSFTGRIQSLKPNSIEDGFRMIRELMLGQSNIKSEKIIPKEFSLSQNYPNPFNPTTKINYALPQGVKVSIKIYDILGRLVKELVNEYKDAGNYTVEFNGTNYASGVYFYRIEAGKFSNVKKMVLVK